MNFQDILSCRMRDPAAVYVEAMRRSSPGHFDPASVDEGPAAPQTVIVGREPKRSRKRKLELRRLWRRGTRDPLTRSGPDTYSGNGYTLTLTDSTDGVASFTIDLKRAPGLQYIRQYPRKK